jgi:hypothetical protein
MLHLDAFTLTNATFSALILKSYYLVSTMKHVDLSVLNKDKYSHVPYSANEMSMKCTIATLPEFYQVITMWHPGFTLPAQPGHLQLATRAPDSGHNCVFTTQKLLITLCKKTKA